MVIAFAIVLPVSVLVLCLCARKRGAKKSGARAVVQSVFRRGRKREVEYMNLRCPCQPGCKNFIAIGRDSMRRTKAHQRSCTHCGYIPDRGFYVSAEDLRKHLRGVQCQNAQGRNPVLVVDMISDGDLAEIRNPLRTHGKYWTCHRCHKRLLLSGATRHVVFYCKQGEYRTKPGSVVYAFPDQTY